MGNQNATALQEGDKRGVNEPPEKSSNENRKLDNDAGDDRQLTPSVENFDNHKLSGDEGGDHVNGSQPQDSYAEEKNKYNDGNEQEGPDESITADKKDIQIDASLQRAMEEKTQDLISNIEKELNGSADSDEIDTRDSKDKNSTQVHDAPWLDSGEEASGSANSTEVSQYVKEENEDEMKMILPSHIIQQQNEPELADSHKITQVSITTSNSDNQEDSRNCSQISSVEDFQTGEDSIPKPTEKPSATENNVADIAIQEERKGISVREEDGVKVEMEEVKADTEKCHEDSSSHDEQDSDSVEKANGHYEVDDFVDAGEDRHKELEGEHTRETSKHELIGLTESEGEIRSDPVEKANGHYAVDDFVDAGEDRHKELEGKHTGETSKHELIVLTESEGEIRSDPVEKANGHYPVDDFVDAGEDRHKEEGEHTGETSKHELIVLTESNGEIRSDPSVYKQANADSKPENKLETFIADNAIREVIPESNNEDPKTINLDGENAKENKVSEEVKTDPIAFATIHPEAVQEIRGEIDLEGQSAKAEEKSQIKKAPSFNFGILNLTALEESDQTPLLFQRKAPDFRSLSSPGDIRFRNPYGKTETTGGEWFCKEKTINIVMERDELAKSTIPFLRLAHGNGDHCPTNNQLEAVKNNRQNEPFMEQSHEDHGGRELVVTKGREIRHSKTRASYPSFLSSCICCTGIGQVNAADP